MNGTDDLRRILDSHADEVGPGGDAARRTAVHDRIGVVRRRRRAGAAGGVALAAAVVAGLVLAPGQDSAGPAPIQPGDTVVVGLDVPETVTSLGSQFELLEATAGQDGSASVDLQSSERPRLVSWATSGPDDEVVLTGVGNPTTYRSADFDNWVVIDPGSAARVTVTAADGQAAVAVYEPVDSDLTFDAYVNGPADDNGGKLLPERYQFEGHVWQRFDSERVAGVDDELVTTVPQGRDDVLVLASVETAGQGVVVREDYGAGDDSLLELSEGSGAGSQGGFVRQPGDEVALRITSGGNATLAFGFYERVD